MTESHSPVVTPARAGLLIWIVPLVALLVGGYLLHREFSSRGPLLAITFQDGSGLEAGKTRILHRGVVIGTVEEVILAPDLASVEVKARLHASAKGVAREGSRFWIARPQISTSGIQGLDTLVRGSHIEVDPGPPAAAERRSFAGYEKAPMQMSESRHYTLHAPAKPSLHAGVPVLFRGIEVGQVESIALAPDATEVRVRVVVVEPYHLLVREGTVFWNAGGVDMKVGLLGARIRTGSLESVLTGAVAFATPPESAEAPLAEGGSHFVLHAEAEEKWLKWVTPIELPLAESTDGLEP
jgi:paraquat-inducible protein B